MKLCGETLREKNIFMAHFFSSDLYNTFYSELKKENLVQFPWIEGRQTQIENPLFFTRSGEMTRFSVVHHHFSFSWSICMGLSFFTEIHLQFRS